MSNEGNPEHVISQNKEPVHKTEKEIEEEHKQRQLFLLGRKIASHFNIRALASFDIKSTSKIFVLTGSHFLIVNPNDQKTVSLFKWKSIDKFVIPENKNEIQMTFRKEKKPAHAEGYTVRADKNDFKISFDKEIFDNAASQIIDVLLRVLTINELKDISISTLKPPAVAPTAKSGLCRFKMGSQGKPPRFDQKTIQLMTSIIQNGTPNVDLSQFDDLPNFLPTFLDCVPFIRTLRSIDIPQITKVDTFPAILKLLKQKSDLKSISIQGKLSSKNLSNLSEAIKNNSLLKLRGIEFGLSSFSSRELNIISDLLSHTSINTLGLHDVFQASKDTAYFCNSVLVPSITENLYCLNLSKTPDIDIELLFPKLSKVRFLSLAYCGLEIIDVFSKLSLITMSRLKEIDLSGNRVSADTYLDENIKLPPYLSSLILNNLSWPTDSFRLFIYQIFKHIPKNLKLSISNAVMDQNEWYKVFDSLENPNENGGFYGLSVLVWDYNPLHKKFFNFLKRNKRLTRLQMNYCFHNSDDQEEVFDKLNDYLSGARNLKTFISRGNDENNFGEDTPKLINVLKSVPNLEQLDILNSHGGNSSLQPIEELCNKHKNMKINFDGLFPDNFEDYKSTYERLVSIRPLTNSDDNIKNNELPSLLRISFPFNDMYHLINTKVIKEPEVRHFQNNFFYSPDEEAERIKKARKANKGRKSRFSQITKGELDQPGNLYFFNADDDFPRYIDESVVDQFRKDVQTFSINGRPEDEVNISDEAFRSMILTSRKFSRSPQNESNNDYSQPQSPLMLRTREIKQQEIEYDDEEEEENENSNNENSDVDDSDNEDKYVKTPKNAKVNENQRIMLSEDGSEEESGTEKQNDISLSYHDEDDAKDNGNDNDNDVSLSYHDEANDNGNDNDDENDYDNDDDEPEFSIPQLVDVKKYNYAGWRKIDKDYTLQNLYSRMTQTRSMSNSLSSRDYKTKSKK